MGTTIAAADPLRPQQPGGMGAGALMALAVHGALVVALAAGVRWRHDTPPVFAAELWAELPVAAAPRANEPEPPRPAPEPPTAARDPAPPPPAPAQRSEADIALERAKLEQVRLERERERLAREQARKERIERERLAEAERQRKAEAELLRKQRELQAKRQAELKRKAELARQERERKAEAARLEALRKQNLERMMGLSGATGSADAKGSAERSAAPSAAYAGRLVAHIKPNIVLTEALPPSLEAVVQVRASPTGAVLARRIVQGSGSSTWDEAVLRAIDRSGRLPADTDGRVPPVIEISFRPE